MIYYVAFNFFAIDIIRQKRWKFWFKEICFLFSIGWLFGWLFCFTAYHPFRVI